MSVRSILGQVENLRLLSPSKLLRVPVSPGSSGSSGSTEQQVIALHKEVHEINRKIDSVLNDLHTLNGSVRDTIIELGGVPHQIGRDEERRSIRARLHKLETDAYAAELTRVNIETIREAQQQARQHGWSVAQKVGLFVCAAIGAFGTVVSLVLLLTT